MLKKTNYRLFAVVTIFLALKALAGTKGALDNFTFLSSIRSPGDLVSPALPGVYSVPVELSGPVAEEINATIKNLDLDAPEYMEIYRQKDGFELVLANEFYDRETRSLLAGVLNPVEMTGVVLGSILRYRQPEKLKAMLGETLVEKQKISLTGKAIWVVSFKPVGERFSYEYEDLGAFVSETWLTSLVLEVDSATMLANSLQMNKSTRLFSADSTSRPQPAQKSYKYYFFYETVSEKTLPSGMTLTIDGVPALAIKSTYRKEKEFAVFDQRSICYKSGSAAQSCLLMKYGAYDLNPNLQNLQSGGKDAKNAKSAKKIQQAAALAIKAEYELRAGNLKAAARILRNIVKNFDGTPQSVEAKKLLDGIPDGL
jgi:hypothetical protein